MYKDRWKLDKGSDTSAKITIDYNEYLQMKEDAENYKASRQELVLEVDICGPPYQVSYHDFKGEKEFETIVKSIIEREQQRVEKLIKEVKWDNRERELREAEEAKKKRHWWTGLLS